MAFLKTVIIDGQKSGYKISLSFIVNYTSIAVCFCVFFLFGFYNPFKNISLISSQSFIKDGRKMENQGKNHLTIRKQNLAFPHVTVLL